MAYCPLDAVFTCLNLARIPGQSTIKPKQCRIFNDAAFREFVTYPAKRHTGANFKISADVGNRDRCLQESVELHGYGCCDQADSEQDGQEKLQEAGHAPSIWQ